MTGCGAQEDAGSDSAEESTQEAQEETDALTVDEESKTISMNILSTGYDESTIHAIVNEEGSNADKSLFTTAADTEEFYDALKQLGAQDGNNIALDDSDGIIEGTGLDVNVEIGTENCSFADLFTASEERDMDIRFGGNLEVNQEYATGCIMCLESCPAGITSNAAYQYQEEITFGSSDKAGLYPAVGAAQTGALPGLCQRRPAGGGPAGIPGRAADRPTGRSKRTEKERTVRKIDRKNKRGRPAGEEEMIPGRAASLYMLSGPWYPVL